MLHTTGADCTRLVDRTRPFGPGPAAVDALIRQLDHHRGDGPALAVAVLDAAGVRVRVVDGAGPRLLAVGRHTACDVRLRQQDASLRHAVVVADDDGVRVLDLSSLCGLQGRSSAAPGRWALVRAGDSVVAAVALTASDARGDVDDLRILCRLLEAPVGLDAGGLPGCHLSLQAREPKSPVASPSSSLSSPSSRRGGDDVICLDDVVAPLLLGRSERCQVRIADNGVSRLHAALVPVRCGATKRAMLVDVGSTNGTSLLQVRGGAIHERALGPAGRGQLVAAGDMVELAGRLRLRVRGAVVDDVAGADRAGGQ